MSVLFGPQANVLLGPSAVDRFLAEGFLTEGKIFPGGGALNMAYHWQQLDFPFTLLTRFGSDESRLFSDFFSHNKIGYLPESAVQLGASASIDVVIRPDRQPWMDNYDEGVTADFKLDSAELALFQQATWVHAILTEGVIAELERLNQAGVLEARSISADFFDFRHFTIDRFKQMMVWIDVAFIGWPHELAHPTVDAIRDCSRDMQKLVVMTLGAGGVRVFDGRKTNLKMGQTFEQHYPIQPKEVLGTTIGCGDTFAAYFLAEWMRSKDVRKGIAQANLGGGLATGWFRALPDSAYG